MRSKNELKQAMEWMKKCNMRFVAVLCAFMVMMNIYAQMPATYWVDQQAADSYGGGSGTSADPYQIANVSQLLKLQKEVSGGNSYSGTYFVLTADIDLGAHQWTAIGAGSANSNDGYPFMGHFDGQGHTISNIYAEWSTQGKVYREYGLFSILQGNAYGEWATVQNLIIDGATFSHSTTNGLTDQVHLGAIVGKVNAYSNVRNIIVRGVKINTGNNDLTFSNNYNPTDIGICIGGIHPDGRARIHHIAAQGEIRLTNLSAITWYGYVGLGGIVGFADHYDGGVPDKREFTFQDFYTDVSITAPSTGSLAIGTIIGGSFAPSIYDNTSNQTSWYYNTLSEGVKAQGTRQTSLNAVESSFANDMADMFENHPYYKDNDHDLEDWYVENGKFIFKTGSVISQKFENDKLIAYTDYDEGTRYVWYIDNGTITRETSVNSLDCNFAWAGKSIYAEVYDGNNTLLTTTNTITLNKLAVDVTSIKTPQESDKMYYSFNITSPDGVAVTTGNGFTIEYQWYNNDTQAGTGATYTTGSADVVSCRVVVKYDVLVLYDETLSLSQMSVIYLHPAGADNDDDGYVQGNDSHDGLTPSTPVRTWKRAYELLAKDETANWNNNIIVLMGVSHTNDSKDGFELTLETQDWGNNTGTLYSWITGLNTNYPGRYGCPATITGKWNGIDYNGNIHLPRGYNFAIYGDTRFQYLTFDQGYSGGQSGADMIFCNYFNLEMGEGLVMSNFDICANTTQITDNTSINYGTIDDSYSPRFQIYGGFGKDARFVTNSGLNLDALEQQLMPHGKEGFSITVKSGHFGPICAGGHQSFGGDPVSNGIMGTPNVPVKCTITIDIDKEFNDRHNDCVQHSNKIPAYDVGLVLAGNHEGAMFGDVNIVIKSGRIGRIVNGTMGALRQIRENGTTGDIYPFDSYFGRANVLIDPNDGDDDNVLITELYGGGLGRNLSNNSDGEVMTTFYGKSTVTINGGIFDIPEGDHIDINPTKVASAIFASGAGGCNGVGNDAHHTDDQYLPYWDNGKLRYGNYDTFKTKTGNDKVFLKFYDSTSTSYDNAVSLTREMFHAWTDQGGDNGSWSGCSYYQNTANEVPYGDPSVYYLHYADLSQYDRLTITYSSGTPRLLFNRFVNEEVPKNKFNPEINGSDGMEYVDRSTPGTWIIDLAAIRKKYGYAHLHAIKAANETVIITSWNLQKMSWTSTTLDPVETSTQITINGGRFGTPSRRIGGIYAGGNGFVNETLIPLNLRAYPNYKAGNIYGKEGETASRLLINGGEFYCNIYGGGKGDPTYFSRIIGEGEAEKYKELGQILGNVEVTISGNAKIHGDVFGAGAGVEQAKGNGQSEESMLPDMARIFGKSTLTIKDNVTIYGYVYGGGDVANINGYQGEATDVKIEGSASIFGNVYGAGKGRLSGYVKDYKVIGRVGTEGGNANARIMLRENASVWGDIYGGGAYGDTYGDTYVNMQGGAVAGDIYGGGSGQHTTESYANVSGSTHVICEGGKANWQSKMTKNVSSGSEFVYNIIGWNEDTKSSFYDEEHGFLMKHNIYGGGYLACEVGVTANVTVTNSMVDRELINRKEWQDEFDRNDHPHFYVFGGGYGELTSVGSTMVNVNIGALDEDDDTSTDQQLAKRMAAGDDFSDEMNLSIHDNTYGYANATVLGIIGGGYDGVVEGNTDVTVGGVTYAHRVFGGGYGSMEGYLANQTKTLGQVGGNTDVKVTGGNIYGDVFGGGAGVEPQNVTGGWIALKEIAAVKGTTSVKVSNKAKIYGNVYGGGDVANVENVTAQTDEMVSSSITVEGGDIFGYTIGGGCGRPRDFKDINNNVLGQDYKNFGNVSGDTQVVINDGTLWNDIYGGGKVGSVSGNTKVQVNGGFIGRDIYGGGWGAEGTYNGGVTDYSMSDCGDTYVIINGGSAMYDRLADVEGNIKRWNDTDINNVDENFFKDGKFTIAHNIYGGGNIACKSGETNVVMNHGLLGGNMFDGKSVPSLCWMQTVADKSAPHFYVFGGGYGKETTTGDTHVDIKFGKAIDTSNGYTEEMCAEDQQSWAAFEIGLINSWDNLTEAEKNTNYNGEGVPVTVPSLTSLLQQIGHSELTTGYMRFRISQLSRTIGVAEHSVLGVVGGGLNGFVGEPDSKNKCSTNVTIDGFVTAGYVFGGGLGSYDYFDKDNSVQEYSALAHVTGNANVTIRQGGVRYEMFGGGAGVEDKMVGDTQYSFPDMATVEGSTKIVIDGTYTGTMVLSNVYGGGDIANVGERPGDMTAVAEDVKDGSFTSDIHYLGGQVVGKIFAGGKGRTTKQTLDADAVGAIYGNTNIIVGGDDSNDKNNIVAWDRIYAGGHKGDIHGNTYVTIDGGNICYNTFGGGWGELDEDGETIIASADVYGNTHVTIKGGTAILDQMWDSETLYWRANNIADGRVYSPQFNPVTEDFTINHNTYGGGNVACTIFGNTHVKMTKGLLNTQLVVEGAGGTPAIESAGFKAMVKKTGNPYHSLFGGGFGPITNVKGNTYVDVTLGLEDGNTAKDNPVIWGDQYDPSVDTYRFEVDHTIFDVIGGGYSGAVDGNTNVHVGGYTCCRHVFGGGFVGGVGIADASSDDGMSSVVVTGGKIESAYGGGFVGDVTHKTYLQIGSETTDKTSNTVYTFDGTTYTTHNSSLFITGSVFGGNDVSGLAGAYRADDGAIYSQEDGGTNVNIFGGKIFGSVYGAGNGDFLYKLDNEATTVSVLYNYVFNETSHDVMFNVPMRDEIGSFKSSTPAQRLVNINSFRPITIAANIHVKGNSTEDKPIILGSVFGGGNSATILDIARNKPSSIKMKFGRHIDINNVYFGSDGDALFADYAENAFLTDFQAINNLNLAESIDWRQPGNHAISTNYLPVHINDRSTVYKNLIDLYFQPVEMNALPELTFDWSENDDDVNDKNAETAADNVDAKIGSFYCGGNRGNMNVYDKVDVVFPKGLTITGNIVGGCNNANYVINPNTDTPTRHVGGFLLGNRGEEKIHLQIKNYFKASTSDDAYNEGCNVYGGCYLSGDVNGDVYIDVRSDMLNGQDSLKLVKARELNRQVFNVYGAGYGADSNVRGNTTVLLGDNREASNTNGIKAIDAAPTFHTNGNPSVNYLFGGGQQGTLIGNSTLHLLNGHVAGSVVGGCYAGYQYGSTQVLVGFPSYYVCKQDGPYQLRRADKASDNLSQTNRDGSHVIKQTVNYLKGDIVPACIYDSLGLETDRQYFEKVTLSPENFNLNGNWTGVNIQVDKAIYGGGYSLASGSSVLAGQMTVCKYTNENNPEDTRAVGYGGNTSIIIWDQNAGSTEHITVSSPILKVASNPSKDNLTEYFYYGENGVLQSCTSEDEYNENVTYYENTSMGEGGVFGDGHLSFAEGFRTAELLYYGYAAHHPENAKLLNTIHRMDVLNVQDCCFNLLGDRDYATNSLDATIYSISRVGELRMISTIDDRHDLINLYSVDDSNPRDRSHLRKSRNYVGFFSNIHYLGAITSNVPFNPNVHNYHREDGTYDSSQGYYTFKEHIIRKYFSNDEGGHQETDFQSRNRGTAKNMVGISNGSPLKIMNVKTVDALNGDMDLTFYGPVVGVFETALRNVKVGDAGGYVYADNIHATNENSTYSFLESTGNFVFNKAEDYHRIVDDCFPTSTFVDEQGLTKSEAHTLAEAHYWYVTGLNYYYDANITAFTSKHQQGAEPKKYEMKTDGDLIVLSGAQPLENQKLTLNSITWISEHPDDYECELETRNYDENALDASDNHLYTASPAYNAYNLKLSTSASNTYSEYEKNGDGTTGAACPTLALSFQDVTEASTSTASVASPEPKIAIQLTDNADNSGVEYYNSHLSRPCKAILVLTTPALNSDGTATYRLATDSEVQNNTVVLYTKDGNVFTQYSGTRPENNSDENYYVTAVYRYQITLNIQYLEGPDVTGKIHVENCALPGELIRISSSDIEIHAAESMSPTGYYWRIGPRVKDNEGNYINELADGKYYTYDVVNKGPLNSEDNMLSGCYIDETTMDFYVPAYYFMNGYGVQYCFKANNVDYPVSMDEEDTLTIHNYHRMGRVEQYMDISSPIAFRLETMAGSKIYIQDREDMLAFDRYIKYCNDPANYHHNINKTELQKNPAGGKGIHFYLQNDIDLSGIDFLEWAAIQNFEGVFHGDGHKIILPSLAGWNPLALFDDNKGEIYNLGVVGGIVANTNSNAIVNCYAYNKECSTSKFDVATVNGDGGNIDNCYINVNGSGKNANYAENRRFHYGDVAYSLNKYYLEKRYEVGSNMGNNANEENYRYLMDYFADGDYLYARTSSASSEYLRTGEPNYNKAETHHNVAHTVDAAHAIYNEGTTELSHYEPLYEAAQHENGTQTDMRNDFIIFGQVLGANPEDFPSAIASKKLNFMTNRVYRCFGYYGSKEKDGFFYNPGAYIYGDMGITAVDFYGWQENPTYKQGLNDDIFYSPMIDEGVTSLTLDPGVTKNLLVYASKVDNTLYGSPYLPSTDVTAIDRHIIYPVGYDTKQPQTTILHLVDNEDFNCPIQFTVTDSAWFERQPVRYVEQGNDGWQPVSLPFTVKKLTATTHGWITHFYGSNNPQNPSNTNQNQIGHEYWLRGLTSYNANTATFVRPVESGGDGFINSAQTEAKFDMTYNNHYLWNITEQQAGSNKDYYRDDRTYSDYLPQTAGVPYIISFPGKRYFEFDMTDENMRYSSSLNNADTQVVINISDDELEGNKSDVGNIVHKGTYQHRDNVYVVNDEGTKFKEGKAAPFTSYLIFASSMAKPYEVEIGTSALERIDVMERNGHDESLHVYVKNGILHISSTYDTKVKVYNVAGMYLRNLDVKAGDNVYLDIRQGIYIVDKTKVRVR